MRNAIFALCAALVAFAAWNIYSLARLPPAVRSAVGDLKDPKAEVRWTAAEKLEKLGPQAKGAQPALIAALNDPEPNGLVALSAAKALVAIGADPDVAIPALVKLLETDRGNAPVWAGRCLILMPGGMEALLNVVRTTNMRETPTHALASFGAEGLPRLEGLLADGDPYNPLGCCDGRIASRRSIGPGFDQCHATQGPQNPRGSDRCAPGVWRWVSRSHSATCEGACRF